MATGLRLRRVAKRRQSILEYFVEVERLFGPSIREIQLHLEGNGFAEVSLGNLNADLCRLREDGYLIHLRDDAKAGEPEDGGKAKRRDGAKPKRQHRPYRLTEKGRAQARSGSSSDLMAKPIQASGDGGRPDGRAAGASAPSRKPYDPPLVGVIAAGNPIDPGALAVDATTLLDELACDPQNVVMKVRGTSMEGADIHDGDYVVVRAQPPEGVSKRDIVVVVTNSEPTEMTLKWVERYDEGLVLHPVSPGGRDWQLQPHKHERWDPDAVSIQGVLRWTICGHRARPTPRGEVLRIAP